MKIRLVASCAILVFAVSGSPAQTKKAVQFTVCELTLSENQKQANLSFTDGFVFMVNSNGSLDYVGRNIGNHVSEDEVRSCVTDWKFSGFPTQSKVRLYFGWEHGVGWTQMEIQTKLFSQKISFTGKSTTDESEGGTY